MDEQATAAGPFPGDGGWGPAGAGRLQSPAAEPAFGQDGAADVLPSWSFARVPHRPGGRQEPAR